MIDKQGLLLCARYSVAPNFLGYCGPDENKNLVDHLKEQIADKEVASILSEFETLYQYLAFIAKENNITDVFDRRVVEAYWMGNALLRSVSRSDYIALLKERLFMEKRIGSEKVQHIRYKVFHHDFYPHHSFHVFNIFKRTGHDPGIQTIGTMDECRINYGQIIHDSKLKTNEHLFVNTRQLELKNHRLSRGKPIVREIRIDYRGKRFVKDFKQGDWVSFHWGFMCDVLTQQQVKNLEFYTQKAIDFFNSA